jgi:protein-disulfide isomerase
VNRLISAVLVLLATAPLFAADVDPRIDRAVRDAVTICNGPATINYQELPLNLPPRFTGLVVRVESERARCAGQYMAVLSPSGNVFIGTPWPIGNAEGKTVEQRLQAFTLQNMGELMVPAIERKATVDGLYPVTLMQTHESGKLPISGVVDAAGEMFFFGQFRSSNGLRESRAKAFDALLTGLPTKGPASAPVTILEFSDFQCPSCKFASGYVDPIVAKHGDKVRYVRFDLPLAGHSWAFPAALAGRAIYRQNPEAFWQYKQRVYENQGELNAFMFWDWARGFAEDHELDLAKYDADLASEEIKSAILRGAGTAFSNDVRATPTYMVNGAIVDAGDDGKALEAYVDSLVKP